MTNETALDLVEEKLVRSIIKFPPMQSRHEGLAILEKEVLELRRSVYDAPPSTVSSDKPDYITEEATQVAAMAIRFLIDCC